MEIDRYGEPAELGPVAPPRSMAPALSTSRRRVLEAVGHEPEPSTLAALAARTGLHANTLREHLRMLEQHGLVNRTRSHPTGRGRPAWHYTAAILGDDGRSEYGGLAAALAAALSRSTADPVADAAVAGEEWGRDLAASVGPPDQRDPAAARRQVVHLLDSAGFGCDPDPGHKTVRLTSCPLLGAARRFPAVVCAVHLGLVRGALAAYGASPDGVRLQPFAEPGACLVDLSEAPA